MSKNNIDAQFKKNEQIFNGIFFAFVLFFKEMFII